VRLCAGGYVLTQHQSRDTETDDQRDTRDGSSGRPGALLQISYFPANLQYTIFYNIIWGLGEDDKKVRSFSGDTFILCGFCRKLSGTSVLNYS
jgi:hypothetical protein